MSGLLSPVSCCKIASAVPDSTSGEVSPLDITAKAAVLIENSSGRILYEKEKDKELIPASITKIMTLLLIFDAIEQKKYLWRTRYLSVSMPQRWEGRRYIWSRGKRRPSMI